MQSVRPHPTAIPRVVPLASRHLGQLLGTLAVALALIVCAACASSSPGGKQAVGGDVSYTTLSSNTKLRIVSDSLVESQGYEGVDAEERRADFYRKNVYSHGGSTAAVKVCDDPIFGGIVQALDEAGFARHATVGSATLSGGGATEFLELTVDGQVRHFARTKGMTADALKSFQTCRTIIGEVFNAVEGYQSGDGTFQFNSQAPRAGG